MSKTTLKRSCVVLLALALILAVSGTEVPLGCEYQFMGAVRGKPIK